VFYIPRNRVLIFQRFGGRIRGHNQPMCPRPSSALNFVIYQFDKKFLFHKSFFISELLKNVKNVNILYIHFKLKNF